MSPDKITHSSFLPSLLKISVPLVLPDSVSWWLVFFVCLFWGFCLFVFVWFRFFFHQRHIDRGFRCFTVGFFKKCGQYFFALCGISTCLTDHLILQQMLLLPAIRHKCLGICFKSCCGIKVCKYS